MARNPLADPPPITLMGKRMDGFLDPLPNYSFYVEIDDVIEGSFMSCDGISLTREVTTLREGGLNDWVHYLPGQVSYGKLTLKNGITTSDKLWKWFLEGNATGKVKRTKVAVIQMKPYTTSDVWRYEMSNAFLESWTGPSLSASGGETAVQSVSIVFSKLEIKEG